MAGEFDDLIPKKGPAANAPLAGYSAPSDEFSDLVPSADQDRKTRLRKLAMANTPPAGAGDLYKDAWTLGLQKPTQGLATGLGNWLTGKSSFGEGYEAGTGAYDEWLAKGREDAGWGGTAATIAGSLTPGAVGKAGLAIKEGMGPVLRSAAELGAVEGAARNADDPASAAKGAVGGAALSAGTAGLLEGGRSILSPAARAERAAARQAARGVPTGDLRAEARSIYRQLDNSGTAYTNQQAADLADTIRADLVQNGWDPQGVHSSLNGVLNRIDDLRNGPVSYETLQQIREQLGSNAQAIEPQVRRIAGRAMRNLDGFVANETPAISNLPPDQIAPMAQQARRAWRAANVAEDIGWRVRKAERRASSANSGQNTENAIRQNIRQVVDKAENPTRYNPYNDAELAQMNRVVEGTPKQNATRWVGNQLSGIPSQTIAGGVGMGGGMFNLGLDPYTAGAAGLALGAGVTGAGHIVKNRAARMAQDEADSLIRLITTGSLNAAPAMQGAPTREALARLVARRQAELGAGRYATKLTGE